MKTSETTARLFTRETRWINVVHTGNTGETVIRIGTIPGDIFLITLPTNEYVKMYKNIHRPMTTEEGFIYLISNVDRLYMGPSLLEYLANIEKTRTPEDVVYLMKNDPAQVYPEFQSRI